jgi:hypothetical protein
MGLTIAVDKNDTFIGLITTHLAIFKSLQNGD